MSLKSFFILSIPALGLLHSCATANNWQNDDVYSMKEPEVPIGTDINDETDYSAYVYNRRNEDRKQQYYSDRQPSAVNRSSYMAMAPGMYMMFGNPYGMSYGYGFGYSSYSRYMGYSPYYGSYYDPFYSSYYGYGYTYSPYYYGYSPYYGYMPYGYSGGNSGSTVSSGSTYYAHRVTYAGVGGASSRPNGAVQVSKPNNPGTTTKPTGNVAEKSLSGRSLASNQATKEVSGLTTPGTNRPSVASGAVRSQNGFNTRPVIRTTENVRTNTTTPATGRTSTPASSGGRIENTGRTNSGNAGAPRNNESRPAVSSPGRSNTGGGMGGSSRPSGGGAVRSGGGSPGRR